MKRFSVQHVFRALLPSETYKPVQLPKTVFQIKFIGGEGFLSIQEDTVHVIVIQVSLNFG